MRIVFGSPVRLDPRLGAAQITLNLAMACRGMGHEVDVWEPVPALEAHPWWRHLRSRRAAFARYLGGVGVIDLVDAPSWMIQPRLRGQTKRLCARSVQPELSYLDSSKRLWPRHGPRAWLVWLHDRDNRRLIERGRRAADRIAGLGSEESRSTKRDSPELAPKLVSYVAAPGRGERARLREIAAARAGGERTTDTARYLWIGRWAPHKGIDELLSFARALLAGPAPAALTVAGCGEAAGAAVPEGLVRSGRLRIVPAFSRTELFDLLAEHDAGLFTSEVEGWGLSLQEMLESGMPVYATRAGAVPDLAPWFPTQLRAFPPVAGEPLPGQESAAAFERYAARFNWERIARDYLEAVLAGPEAR